MDYEFKTKEELFKRVRPALLAKEVELHRLGYLYISINDIWNYLIECRWKNGNGLMLSDIVSDIMRVDGKEISIYLKKDNVGGRRSQNLMDSREII